MITSTFAFPASVEGYLTEAEGEALYELALRFPEDAILVELGTYKGKSAICLAQSGRKLYSFDHYKGEITGIHYDHVMGGYSAKQNIETYCSGPECGPVVLASMDTADGALTVPDESVSLVFVDASHELEGVQRDFLAWAPKVISGGLMVFHDVLFDGVRQAMELATKFALWTPDFALAPPASPTGLAAIRKG